MKEYPFGLTETTVEVARQWTYSNASEGAVCPCCEQLVKVYRRKLYSTMGYVLLLIHLKQKEHKSNVFLHIPSLLNGKGVAARGGDFAKLKLWDLIEQDANEPEGGYYRMTEKGRQFAECRIAVPDALYIYDGALLRWDTKKLVTIVDVLGKKYNYEELVK